MDGVEHEAEESSSQRRERLLALRSAASASPAGAPPPAPSGSLLPDPELPGDQASCPRPRPPQRFDYYTNPAAAFSSSYSCGATNPTWSHKRKSPPACYDPRPAPPPPAYVFELVPSKATPRKRAIIVQRCARPQGVRWVGRSCAACSTFSPRCWSSRSVEEDAAALCWRCDRNNNSYRLPILGWHWRWNWIPPFWCYSECDSPSSGTWPVWILLLRTLHFSKHIVVTLVYAGVVVSGFLVFGESTMSQFTLNLLPRQYIPSKTAIWMTIVNPYTKYALTMTPVNLSIEEALPQKIQSYLVGMFVRTCLVLSNVAVALLFPYFTLVMALLGSVFTMLVLILCIIIKMIGVVCICVGSYISINQLISSR